MMRKGDAQVNACGAHPISNKTPSMPTYNQTIKPKKKKKKRYEDTPNDSTGPKTTPTNPNSKNQHAANPNPDEKREQNQASSRRHTIGSEVKNKQAQPPNATVYLPPFSNSKLRHSFIPSLQRFPIHKNQSVSFPPVHPTTTRALSLNRLPHPLLPLNRRSRKPPPPLPH